MSRAEDVFEFRIKVEPKELEDITACIRVRAEHPTTVADNPKVRKDLRGAQGIIQAR